jgi:cytochrome c-type biogenesis protein
LAVPFLLSAVAVERFLDFFTRMKRQMNWITRTSGVLMVAVGILLVTNYFTVLASALQAMTPEALRSRL